MVRKLSLAVGLIAGTMLTSEIASAHGHCYHRPVVVARPVAAYQSMYRAPVYGVAPVYQPVQVYRAPVYGYPSRGINIGIGIGGPAYGYGPRMGFGGYRY